MSIYEDKLFDSPIATRKVLIVCLGNTCRSIMFHSLLKELNGYKHSEIFSRGVEVKQNIIEENTIKVLNDNKINIIKDKPNSISDYEKISFDEIIVLDETINIEQLPYTKKVNQMFFKDPYSSGIEEYEKVLNKMKKSIKDLKKY